MNNETVKFTVDNKTADDMLQNVFAAVGATPNEIPLEAIIKKNQINLINDNILMIITGIIILFTLIFPWFIQAGNLLLSVDYKSDRSLSVVTHEVNDDIFTISFDGESIDITNSYMEDNSGNTYYAIGYDKETNSITFPFVMQEYNIYIYAVNGKSLHLLLSPR